VGIRPLTDDVPFVPAIKRNDNVQESMLDVESIVQGSDYRNIRGTVPIVIRDSNDIDATFTHLAGDLAIGNPRPPVIIVDEVQLPYAMAQVDEFVDDFKTVKHNNPHSSIVDTESLVDMYNPSMDTQRLEELFTQGTFLIPVVRRESNGTFTPISGGRYVAEYKNAIKASGDRLQERMRVNIVNGDTVAETATPTGRNTEVATPANKLYHGTRVKDLNLGSVDPLEGAARSEYGTGLWLTNSQDIALAASGRSVPANSVPNVNRVFTDDSFIHELDADVLQDLNIVKATDEVDVFTRSSLVDGVLDSSDAIDDVVPYGLRLREELSEALDFKKGLKYSDIFSITDDMTRKVSNKVIGTDPDELELTYVQRWITDILKRNDIDGMTNGVNTAVYNTYPLKARFVHDVTDIAGDAGDDITTALHSVNLLQKSYDADPTSTLLKVQLEEAKLVATARVRDSLSDELETLNALQSRQLSELMDQDDVLKQLTEAQRAEARIKASVKDDNTYDSFSKELNKDWNGPCL
jgi:hypothetical protein